MSTSNQSVRGTSTPVGAATTHKIYNVSTPITANTEFSQALSSGVKQLMIRCRESNKIQFSFVSGESGTKFITISKNAVYKAAELNLSSSTLYMQVDGASLTVEIEEWT